MSPRAIPVTPSPAALPRVLIVAEHASARFGGESILPLHYFRFLRERGVEVWLVVHERTRGELEDCLSAEDLTRVHYVPDLPAQRLACSLGDLLPGRFWDAAIGPSVHLMTQQQQRALVKELVPRLGIDVVHEPMPVSPKAPSLMHDLGAPVVIGPMNGGMTFPPGFRTRESVTERALVGSVRTVAGLMNRAIPGKRKASALLVANPRTAAALPPGLSAPVIELVENGVDLSLWQHRKGTASSAGAAEGPVRFLFMGRMVDWKGVDLLLHALAGLQRRGGTPPVVLDLLGDGAERHALEVLARELGLETLCRFHGFLPQRDCADYLAAADVLVLPSLYECGGAVVLEAMAAGKPVIATAWGGPADYLDETCGVLVEPTSRVAFIAGLTDAMAELAGDRERRERLGSAGRAKAERDYDWRRKVDQILEVYRMVLGRREAHA